MTPTRKRRLIAILVIIVGVAIAATITFRALNENMLFFVSPSDVPELDLPTGQRFRLGGLVADNSVSRDDDSLAVTFVITDGPGNVDVKFVGILPDLFREGQGIIAIGALAPDGHFEATEVLAKHDEEYMPPEIAEALEKSGHPMSEKQNADNGQ